MVTEAHPAPAAPAVRPATGFWSWVTTVDHKRIGILYLFTTFFFFAAGGLMALVIRLQLEHANNQVVSPQAYNQLFTMHGKTMIFLFVVPVMAGFGNYLVPLQIGARDMAFPKLNALSRGKATSRAPIWRGIRKLKNAADSGMTTRKIIVVPCIVNSWLNSSADTAVPFGPLSCQRMISASRPPMPNQASAVYM